MKTEKLARFEEWKKTLVTDENILGGETFFRTPSERSQILQDYPYLTAEDVEFAEWYAAEENP